MCCPVASVPVGVLMNVIYEDNHLLVIDKPANMPAQADQSLDPDVLTVLKQDLKARYHKPGDVYLGLVHRLDRPASGLMVLAKTSKAAARLSEAVRTHQIEKGYLAVVLGHPTPGRWVDWLRKDARTNRVSVVSEKTPGAKRAELDVTEVIYLPQKDCSLVTIRLLTGRAHQIRVQCASRGYPLWGDQRYNKKAVPKQQLALISHHLAFTHPVRRAPMFFDLPMPDRLPFTWFK